MLSEFKCQKCQVSFVVGSTGPLRVTHCVHCGKSDLEFVGTKEDPPTTKREVRPRQEDIRDVFGLGQTVLVRTTGKEWWPREIESITVLRNDDGSLEPRFWFHDYGNVPASEVIAEEDISPPDRRLTVPLGTRAVPRPPLERKEEDLGL